MRHTHSWEGAHTIDWACLETGSYGDLELGSGQTEKVTKERLKVSAGNRQVSYSSDHSLLPAFTPSTMCLHHRLRPPSGGRQTEPAAHEETPKGKRFSLGETLGHFLEVPLQRYSVPSEALWHTEMEVEGVRQR